MKAKSLTATFLAGLSLLTIATTSSAQRHNTPWHPHFVLPCDGRAHLLDRGIQYRGVPVVVTSDKSNLMPIEILPLDLHGGPILLDQSYVWPGQALGIGGVRAYQIAVVTPYMPGRLYTGMIYDNVTIERNGTGKCGESTKIMLDPKPGTWTIELKAEDGGRLSDCEVQVRVAIDTGRKDDNGIPITEYIPMHQVAPGGIPPAKQVDLPLAGYPEMTKYLWIEVLCIGSQQKICRWTLKLTWTPPR